MIWLINDGYVRQVTWNQEAELITLMLWGPGDLILGTQTTFECRNETCTLSHVCLESHRPSDGDILDALRRQISRSMEIMRNSRIRRADDRLIHMLRWMAAQFGRVNSMGHSLSMEEMNLTHQVIAELTGLTRVTVTKGLNRFKSTGQAVPVGQGDLLLPHP
ncbi:Crp/Fnr family transcriptional regulator [Synechococcus sp. CS-205]|jgi:CRP-like cAMP-binding protein|nr:Crp/Fnr family transcriptional regulator [Synechococcus sp. CS-205]